MKVIIDFSEDTQDERCFIVNIMNRLTTFLKCNIDFSKKGDYLLYDNANNTAKFISISEKMSYDCDVDSREIDCYTSWCKVEQLINKQ